MGSSKMSVCSTKLYVPLSIALYFRRINAVFTPKRFRFNAYYLVIVTSKKSTQAEYLEILKIFHGHLILKVNVIARAKENPQTSIVYTYHPYLPGSCNRPKLIIHNKFKDGAFLAETNGLFTPRLRNLYRCPLRVATFNISRFLRVEPTDDAAEGRFLVNRGIKLIGFEGNFIKTLAEVFNFTIDVTMPDEKWGEIHPNGTYTGASKLVSHWPIAERQLLLSLYLFSVQFVFTSCATVK